MKFYVALMSVVLLLLTAQSVVASPESLLEGKTFRGEVIQKSDNSSEPDDFVFANGQFSSSACTKYGYGSGEFSVEERLGQVLFNAETANEAGDRIKWSGSVQGDRLVGGARRITKSGAVYPMEFTGTELKVEGSTKSVN